MYLKPETPVNFSIELPPRRQEALPAERPGHGEHPARRRPHVLRARRHAGRVHRRRRHGTKFNRNKFGRKNGLKFTEFQAMLDFQIKPYQICIEFKTFSTYQKLQKFCAG